MYFVLKSHTHVLRPKKQKKNREQEHELTREGRRQNIKDKKYAFWITSLLVTTMPRSITHVIIYYRIIVMHDY